MSSSAFTPSTTTVTNNVPVNVPVVEATELYTVTVSQGTLSSQRVFKSRSGDRLIIQGNLVFSAGNASTNPVEISLPSGLTADLSKINTGTGALGGSIGSAGILDVSAAKMVSLTAWTNSTTFGFSVNGSSENLRGADIGAGDYVNFFVSIPISQWAGSGTTTLATRAVEEYAFNTSTSTTTSDTTSFGYGPNGAVIQNITANIARRVQFQSNIQSSDNISVEISADRITWIPVGGLLNGQVVDSFRFDGTNLCGIGINVTPGFLNQVDVQFGIRRTTGGDWSGIVGTYYWRVRKVSSGAQVGYPVSARNIVGDTSGNVVPVGMLGQVVEVNLAANLIVNSTTESDASNLSLSLGAGTWLISYSLSANVSTNSTLNNLQGLLVRMTDSSNIQLGNSLRCAYCKNNASGGSNQDLIYTLHAQEVVTISSTQSYKVRARILGATGGGGVLYQDSTYGQSKFMAIRIA